MSFQQVQVAPKDSTSIVRDQINWPAAATAEGLSMQRKNSHARDSVSLGKKRPAQGREFRPISAPVAFN
jgi:hypothetical protein